MSSTVRTRAYPRIVSQFVVLCFNVNLICSRTLFIIRRNRCFIPLGIIPYGGMVVKSFLTEVAMTELPASRKDLIIRLKKIEGQIRGIQNMVSSERECTDVLMQLAAVRSAVESVAVIVLNNFTHLCMTEDKYDPNVDIARAVAMWVGSSVKPPNLK